MPAMVNRSRCAGGDHRALDRGIGGHPGARENSNRPSRWGSGGAKSVVAAVETGHPDPLGAGQGPTMVRSPLPTAANTLDPGHSMTRRSAPTTHRRVSRCPSGSQSYGLSGLRTTVIFPPLTLNCPPIRRTLTQHRYLSLHLNPDVRHPSESVFGIGRNQRSTSSEYGPIEDGLGTGSPGRNYVH